ncbi:MAG TPA: PLD nuclease N-terminal domain-containing protein [Amycolatopsis sp.]|nr:PLD nuclease N-terminal domain-containing protein [Amycolatopsis sp.]
MTEALGTTQHVLGFAGGGAIMLIVLFPLVFFVVALISILGSQQTGGMKVVWIVFAFCAPFLGPLLWFIVGRRASARAQS